MPSTYKIAGSSFIAAGRDHCHAFLRGAKIRDTGMLLGVFLPNTLKKNERQGRPAANYVLLVFFTSFALAQSGAPRAASNAHAIRKMDLAPALAQLFQTANYCGEKSVPEIAQAEYGDLDGDGKEEAAVTAVSCASGSGGPDLFAVFRVVGGKLRPISMDVDWNQPLPKFKGQDTGKGIGGHQQISMVGGMLHVIFPVYKEHDSNCCPSGGERHLIFKWDGKQLKLSDVKDEPESNR